MEALRTYLKDIRHIPLLTAKEEIGLSRKIKKGDEQARKAMIRGNLRLVINIAKRYMHIGVPFLDLIEVNFSSYLTQLIPATTILDGQGTVIRNTVFNRQKFVYKPGLNDGSEFRTKIVTFEPSLQLVDLTPRVNDQIQPKLTNISIEPFLAGPITATLVATIFNPRVEIGIGINISTWTVDSEVQPAGTLTTFQSPTLLK